MALQLWLPLNGDIKNYGLCDVEISGNPNSWENGKIGKCGLFNNNCLYMNNYSLNLFQPSHDKSISIACWVKCTRTENTASSYILAWSAYEFLYSPNRITFRLGDGNKNTYGTSGTINGDGWHHVVGIWDAKNKKVQIYFDGELFKDITVSQSINFNSVSNSATLPYRRIENNLSINDFRLYDECLSPKQVKYISQAMICHYPMGNVDGKIGGRNLLKQCISAGKKVSKIDDLSINIGVGSSVGDTYFYLKSWLPLTGGEIYTISCDAENVPSGAPDWIFGVRKETSLFAININKNGRCYGTGVLDNDIAADTWFLFDDRNHPYTTPPNIKLSNFKLEKGNIATDWTPAPEDNPQFYDNIIPDISGYQNNATIKDSTSPTWSDDSPRYLGSYKFDKTKEMLLNPIVFSGFADSYTFSWWGKNSQSDSSMYWGFIDGNRLNLYNAGGYLFWNIGDGRNNPFNDPVTTNKVSSYTDGKWHHYCITGDGASNKLYVDGKIYGIAKTYRKITGTKIHINGWDDGVDYKINGNISDFRIYATALSESDVLNLYQSSASLDSQGNLMLSGEVIE